MRHAIRGLLMTCASTIAIGCAPGEVEGSVKGKALEVESGVSMSGPQFTGAWSPPEARVVILTNTPDLCEDFEKTFFPGNAVGLVFLFYQTDADKKTIPIEPGTYRLVPTTYGPPKEPYAQTVQAEWVVTSNECKRIEESGAAATDGTVKIESISSTGRITGSFSLKFGEESVKGSFAVRTCDAEIPKTSEQVCE